MLNAKPAAQPSDDITVAFETSIDEATWVEFVTKVSPPLRFLAHGWWQAWADVTLPHDNWRGPLRLAVARDRNGVVQAVLPTAQQVMLGLSVLSLAGNYKPFRSWLIALDAPPAIAAALVSFYQRTGIRAFRMGPVESAQPEIRSLMEAFSEAGWRFCKLNEATDYLIDLPVDIDTYKAMLSARKFKRIRANMNRLKKQGHVHIEHRSNLNQAGWQATMASAAAIERASWLNGAEGDLNYADETMAAFWKSFLAHPAASCTKQLWLLYLDDRPISFTAALDSGDYRYVLSGTYDQAFKDASPGTIIDSEVILGAFERGIRVINMGQGDSGYKANWGVTTHESLEDWIAFPPTAAGRLLHLAARAKFGKSPS